MAASYSYKVDVFQVELVEAPENEVRKWDEERCECPKYHEKQRDPRCKRQDDIDCQHIRTAKLFHMLQSRVSVGEEAGEKSQQSLAQFAKE